MEQHVNWLTQFVNHYLGGVALSVLTALHIQPTVPAAPIPESVVMLLVVFVIGGLATVGRGLRLFAGKPGAAQQIAEMLLTNPLTVTCFGTSCGVQVVVQEAQIRRPLLALARRRR
jgi:hypothetical protein